MQTVPTVFDGMGTVHVSARVSVVCVSVCVCVCVCAYPSVYVYVCSSACAQVLFHLLRLASCFLLLLRVKSTGM
jgi:hypothetical protein